MTATRRKYIYKTRQAAEGAARQYQHDVGILCAALNAVRNGDVEWSDHYTATGTTSAYQFGVVRRRHSFLVLITFFCPSTGQAPSTTAHEEDTVRELYRLVTAHPPIDDEARAYRQGLADTLVKLNQQQ